MTEPNERLRLARVRANFKTPAQAAARFGWSKDTYKSHENGVRGIRPKVAEKYGQAFGVSAAFILTGESSGIHSITNEESDLLQMFRLLSTERRKTVLDLCEALAEAAPVKIARRSR
jgi:hypothetical protein